MANLSERLHFLRKERNLKQEELSEQTGIGYRSYRRYESGEREPTSSTIIALADFFVVSADYLLGRSDEQ